MLKESFIFRDWPGMHLRVRALPLLLGLVFLAATKSACAGSLATDLAALLSFKNAILKEDENSWYYEAVLQYWTGPDPCQWGWPVECTGHRVTSFEWSKPVKYGVPPYMVNGSLSPEFGALDKLKKLHLKFAGNPFPTAILGLTNLEWLIIEGTSSIPDSISRLKKLKTLEMAPYVELQNDPPSGSCPIPPSIGTLPELTQLSLRGGFTGPIPPQITNLKSLQNLGILFTLLTGPIPPSIGNLTSLRYLYVHQNNGLTGPIPPSIGNLSSLEALTLSDNKGLTCSIPPEIANLESLGHLALDHNELRGVVTPPLVKFLERLDQAGGFVYLDKNYLAGDLGPTLSGSYLGSNCFQMTPCNKFVEGQRPFSECQEIYPALRQPCLRGGGQTLELSSVQ